MGRVVVIGAGPMGLAAAYRAAKNGHDVDVVEAGPVPGGMAGHFDFAGTSIERFYHFVCKSDQPTFAFMRELDILDKIRWKKTSMGLYTEGRMHDWGSPLALLKIPILSPLDKLRYALFAFVSLRRNRWPAIEGESAETWIQRWCGEQVYRRLWKPLFDYKFYEYADNISATWIWTRIRRIGRSRASIMQEELGYIEGGSVTLVDALVGGIQQHGGRVHLGQPVETVTTEGGRVTGVQTATGHFAADHVISTIPTPLVNAMVPDLPPEWKEKFDSIHNVGCICVTFRLKRSVSPHFWVNVSVPEVEIPGFIEFTNLRDVGGDTVLYVPFYMPTTNPKFSWTDEQLQEEAFSCLLLANPALKQDDIIAAKVSRLRYGQPICEPEFASKVPPIKTPITNLQIADTCYYYPEDRGIAESLRLGSKMAEVIDTGETIHPYSIQ